MANDFSKEIQEILSTFAHGVTTDLDEACQKVAKEGAKTLRKSSPKGSGPKSGRYAKGWAVKKDRDGQYYIYNRTDYQLTHLLEKGHDIIRNGKVTGYSPAIPHIKPVEEWAQGELPKEMEERIKAQK